MRKEADQQGKTVFETVTFASILEREIGNANQSAEAIERDRRMVSDLFWRRLRDNHALESDATLEYARGESKVQHSIEETRFDSPYNTYRYRGLPPGPISNPGLASLRATLFPLSNPYYFFLNNPKTGETFFAVTFEEHKHNKVKNGL
ncbi:MAG: endolytic transglycosylase MltG [Candidatus Moraniibacteriota bacterium]|nr:MAG: endolytic transglycosylase MltG [Candidatus Moranbacteria bacterium]